MEPQKAEEGEFTDLEGLDLMSKLDLLRKNEQWKCQVKKEALEVRVSTIFVACRFVASFLSYVEDIFTCTRTERNIEN